MDVVAAHLGMGDGFSKSGGASLFRLDLLRRFEAEAERHRFWARLDGFHELDKTNRVGVFKH